MMEEWRVINQYPDYAVSNLGRVKRLGNRPYSKTERTLKPFPNEKGYLMVKLAADAKPKTLKVHILVLEHFVSERPEGKEGNHKDGDKGNNRLDNLEWLSHPANIKHCYAKGLKSNRGDNNGSRKLSEVDVYRIKGLLFDGGMKQTEIAKIHGVHKCTINAIKRGQNWSHVVYP